MTDVAAGSQSYPPGSNAAFSVLETFPPNGGIDALLRSDSGDLLFAQRVSAGQGGGGDDMVSARLNNTKVTFTVERSFASGYLILGTALGERFFATIVEHGVS